jgi:hypothetical protein
MRLAFTRASRSAPTAKVDHGPADPVAIAWVLADGKMGFVGSRKLAVGRLRVGDTALLYATEGTLSPEGMVSAEVRASGETDKVGTRGVELEIDLTVLGLAEHGTGVPIASLVPELRLFAPYRQPSSWRAVLYRPFGALYAEDENVVRRALEPVVGAAGSERIASYATD